MNREQQIMEVIGDTRDSAVIRRWQERDTMVVSAITKDGITSEELSRAFRVSLYLSRQMLRHAGESGLIVCVLLSATPRWFLPKHVEAAKAERKRLQKEAAVRHKEIRRQAKIRQMKRVAELNEQKKLKGPFAAEVPIQVVRTEWEPVKVAGPRSVFELA